MLFRKIGLIVILSLLLLVIDANTQEVQGGEKELYIPEDRKELEEYYIELASMYQEQKDDLENAMKLVEKYKKINKEKQSIIEKQQDLLDEGDQLIEDIPIYYLSGGVSLYFPTTEFNPEVLASLNLTIKNDLLVEFGVSTEPAVLLGVKYNFLGW